MTLASTLSSRATAGGVVPTTAEDASGVRLARFIILVARREHLPTTQVRKHVARALKHCHDISCGHASARLEGSNLSVLARGSG